MIDTAVGVVTLSKITYWLQVVCAHFLCRLAPSSNTCPLINFLLVLGQPLLTLLSVTTSVNDNDFGCEYILHLKDFDSLDI